MYVLAFAPAVFCCTLLGGLFAFFLRDRRHLILGFSAGAVVGVAFFDLLPETFRLSQGNSLAGLVAVLPGVGFLTYLLLDRLAVLHSAAAIESPAGKSVSPGRGALGAASLVTHSMLDGVAIGFAFQVSHAIGIVVAAAVLTHDFSDGINTTNVILKNGGTARDAIRWLLADALAPAIGIASTLAFKLPEQLFGLVLALFAGFFLYLGASDLVPESHHAHPKHLTTVATVLGALLVWAAAVYVS